jgi:hypothetical protein
MYIRSIALGKSLFIAHAISSWRTALSTSTKYSYDSFGNITALTGSLMVPSRTPHASSIPKRVFDFYHEIPATPGALFKQRQPWQESCRTQNREDLIEKYRNLSNRLFDDLTDGPGIRLFRVQDCA